MYLLAQSRKRTNSPTFYHIPFRKARIQGRKIEKDFPFINRAACLRKLAAFASMQAIADRESFHGMLDYWGADVGRDAILEGIMEEIRKNYTPEEFQNVLVRYKEALRGVYSGTAAEVDQNTLEELLADAYAGINAFGAGATKFSEAVQTFMRDNHMSRESVQDNGTEQPTGPPQQAGTLQQAIEQQWGGQPAGQKENTAEIGGERYSAEKNWQPEGEMNDYNKPISIQDVFALRDTGRRSVNKFDHDRIVKAQKWAAMYKKLGAKSPFFRAWFGEWRANDITPIYLAKIPQYVDSNEFRKKLKLTTSNKDTGWIIQISNDGINNTMHHAGLRRMSEFGLAGIRELVNCSVLLNSEVHEHHGNNPKGDRISFDHKLYALGEGAEGIALYRITVEEIFHSPKKPGAMRFHNLKYIEKVADNIGSLTQAKTLGAESTGDEPTTKYTIADLVRFVNQYDPEYTSPPEASKVVNGDATPKVVYHGSPAMFTEFSYGHIGSSSGVSFLGEGFYFTDKQELVEQYGENVYPCYLQMKTPYYAKAEDAYNLDSAELERQGYDGVILDASNGQVYMVFKNTQIKSATDNIGTFDGGNPDIRYSVDDDVDVSGELGEVDAGKESVASEYPLPVWE